MICRQQGQKPRSIMITRCSSCLACGRVHPVVFFNPEALQHQEVKGHHGQGDMMMPAAPGASLKVIQSQFGLQLLIVLLHPPTHLGPIDQPTEVSLLRQIGKPIFRGSCFAGGHSISSQQTGSVTLPFRCSGAGCTLSAAKRLVSGPLLPWRQVIFRQTSSGSLWPNSPTLTGAGKARLQVRGRPRPA